MDLSKPPLSVTTIIADFAAKATQVPADPATMAPILRALPKLTRGYYPWRTFKHVAREAGVQAEDAWKLVALTRLNQLRVLEGLHQGDGKPFVFSQGGHLTEPLHRIDRAAGGGGPASLDPNTGILGDDVHHRRIRIRTLMDEAAESSIIEGAASTRRDAIELLRSGREPKKRAERMIVNNYIAMQQIKDWLDRPLSVQMLIELQDLLTRGTLDKPGEAGRLRRSDEPVQVWDDRDNTPIYTPPSAHGLEARLDAICTFANQPHAGAEFIHPVIKAAILHFMIGYEHPFCDGNGRTARAVFYWHSLRSRYAIFEYLAISEMIRKGYARYPQAYVDSEQDGGDLTYFILYKLDIIEQSLDKLGAYLKHEEDKLQRSERLVRLSTDLNLRQRLLLEHSLRHPNTQYTVRSHMNSNGITPVTARADLQALVVKRLMTTTKRGKEVLYLVSPSVAKRLAKKSPR